MKNLTLILTFVTAFAFSQPAVFVWNIRPKAVCPLDTIYVNYKFTPNQDTVSIVFNLEPLNFPLFIGKQSVLASKKKEFILGDSCYLLKLVVPLSAKQGDYSVRTTGNKIAGANNSFTVNFCAGVGIEEHELNQTPIYFDLYGNRTEFKPNVILIEQTGRTRKKVLRVY